MVYNTLTPEQTEITKMSAEISALKEKIRELQWKLDNEKSKGEVCKKEIELFRSIVSNMSMTPAQKIGCYGLYVAEKEEKERLERCIIPECERNICQSDKANFVAAKKNGLVHIAYGRICNIARISRHAVDSLLRLLFVNGYIQKRTVKYWMDDKGGQSIREAIYIRISDISPGEIKFAIEIKKKNKDITSVAIPVKCSSCGSTDLNVEIRSTCKECGSVRTYTGESIKF